MTSLNMLSSIILRTSGMLVIALLGCLLYIPFLNNGFVFDDHNLFTNLSVYDFATPFSTRIRAFPYFTLAFVEIQTRSIEVHRIISLLLHILCSWMLFALLTALLRQALKTSQSGLSNDENRLLRNHTIVLSSIGTLWFTLNPIAVYGAGYLVQRTILFATLFSLLSMWFYRRALEENRTVDMVTAALFYSAAVFSKEHAIMVAPATIGLSTLYAGAFRSKAKRAGLYLALCMPAAIAAVIKAKSVISASYEPNADLLLAQLQDIPLFQHRWGQWFGSIVMQADLFFKYPSYWIVPDVRSISADMRVDFSETLKAWWIAPKVALFVASPVVALYLLKRGKSAALFGCGLLYCWLTFLTELAAVRIQEPFVLYRSYIWAPGYALMLVAIFRAIPLRWLAPACIPVFAVFLLLARERLQSLSSEGAVWMDAAHKLKSDTLPGSSRILYNQGLQYIREKKYAEAIVNFTRASQLTPNVAQIYFQRGVAFYYLRQFDKALVDLDQSVTLKNEDGRTHYALATVLERLGCTDAAMQAYRASLRYGAPMATLKINELSKKITSMSIKETAANVAPLCSR